jgi:hypothetical protein
MAALFALLWVPVGLKLWLPERLAVFFIFGGFALPPLGSLIAAIALWRSGGASRLAMLGLAANALLCLPHLVVWSGGFYTA